MLCFLNLLYIYDIGSRTTERCTVPFLSAKRPIYSSRSRNEQPICLRLTRTNRRLHGCYSNCEQF